MPVSRSTCEIDSRPGRIVFVVQADNAGSVEQGVLEGDLAVDGQLAIPGQYLYHHGRKLPVDRARVGRCLQRHRLRWRDAIHAARLAKHGLANYHDERRAWLSGL